MIVNIYDYIKYDYLLIKSHGCDRLVIVTALAVIAMLSMHHSTCHQELVIYSYQRNFCCFWFVKRLARFVCLFEWMNEWMALLHCLCRPLLLNLNHELKIIRWKMNVIVGKLHSLLHHYVQNFRFLHSLVHHHYCIISKSHIGPWAQQIPPSSYTFRHRYKATYRSNIIR